MVFHLFLIVFLNRISGLNFWIEKMKKTVKYKNVTNASSKELDFKTTLIADKQVPSIRS